MQDFRQVAVWQKAHQLVLRIYRETDNLPKSETFGLLIQLRRGATAIATRIAEGAGRDSDLDFAQDLRRARAGCNEVEYSILLARDLEYFPPEVYDLLTEQVTEVRKMLSGLLKKL